jgi:(4-O-methyl)-D-glucuronate---lignin esterase
VSRARDVVALALVTPLAIAAAQTSGWHARPEAIALATKQQPGFNYEESRVASYTLPDPLAHNGATVTSVEAWRARRTEILNLFAATVYGRSPGRPDRVEFSVLEDNRAAMDGAATLRRIAVTSHHGQRSRRFELTLFLPNTSSGAAPALARSADAAG